MNNKIMFNWEHTQGVDPIFLEKILELFYISIKNGAQKALDDIIKKPSEYDYRNAKPVRINSLIKKEFIENLYSNNELKKKVNHYKSHGVDYFLIDGKFLVCLKKIDRKGRISGYYSKRFKAILNGDEKVPYSKDMLEQLSKMGILKPLPILFIGHTLNTTGLSLDDVKCVNYKNGNIDFSMSLKDMFTPNLFNQYLSNKNEMDTDSKVWTPKIKGERKSQSS